MEPGDDAGAVNARQVAPGASFDPELADLLARGGAAWNRGDIEGVLALADPELEFSPELDDQGRPMFPGLRPIYRGQEEVHEHWSEWSSVFEGGVTVEPIGIAYGAGCAVVLNRYTASGRDGVTTERDIASAIDVRDGRILCWRNFVRWEDALAALGLPTDLAPGPA